MGEIMSYKKIGLIIILSLVTCSAVNGEDTSQDLIKIKINDEVFDVKLENNSAVDELVKTLTKSNVTVNATDYGNFEKVGDLGFTLPTSDENINTHPVTLFCIREIRYLCFTIHIPGAIQK